MIFFPPSSKPYTNHIIGCTSVRNGGEDFCEVHTIFAPRYQLLKEQAAILMQWHFHVSRNWPTKCNSVWSGFPTRRHDKWRYVLSPFKQSCCQITEQTIHFSVCRWIESERARVWVQKGFWMMSCYSGFATFLCAMLKVRRETNIWCLSGHGVSSETHLQIVSKHPKGQSKMEVQHFCHSHLLHS